MDHLARTAAFLGTFAMATLACAETPADRNLARKLAGEALDLFKAADYSAALGKFEQAHRLVPAPTLAVRVARCLDKLGRMKDAGAHYRMVIALELKPFAQKVHVEAREDAVTELAKLNAATPRLTVVLSGPVRARGGVSVDGHPAEAALGEAWLLDPGVHEVSVTLDGAALSKTVVLERGKSERLEFRVPSPAEADGASATFDGTGTVPVEKNSRSKSLDTAGWVLTGLGGAGLVVGALGTGLLYSHKATLDSRCPGGACYSDDPVGVTLANAYNRERVVASVGWIGGGALSAIGVALLVGPFNEARANPSRPAVMARLVPIVSPEFLGVFGRF